MVMSLCFLLCHPVYHLQYTLAQLFYIKAEVQGQLVDVWSVQSYWVPCSEGPYTQLCGCCLETLHNFLTRGSAF